MSDNIEVVAEKVSLYATVQPIPDKIENLVMLSPTTFPSVPAFVESLRANSFSLPWGKPKPKKLFLLHERAVPMVDIMTRPQLPDTQPGGEMRKAAKSQHYHQNGELPPIWVLWQALALMDVPFHHVAETCEEKKAMIWTCQMYFWVTAPLTNDPVVNFAPGVIGELTTR